MSSSLTEIQKTCLQHGQAAMVTGIKICDVKTGSVSDMRTLWFTTVPEGFTQW